MFAGPAVSSSVTPVPALPRGALAALLVAALATLPACPTYTTIPDAERERIDKAHAGELLFLRQSMYVGTFYDDDRYNLVHPRRFDELTYLQTIEGDPIHPPPATGVIPAGTRVRVERLEWPTGDVVIKRPLYTPRYTTWIWLRVARERGSEVTIERDRRHILLLPGGIKDAATFDLWLDAALTRDDPNPWLLSLPPEQQRGIEEKRAVLGMRYDALTAALGYPDTITREVRDGSTLEVGVWGAVSVVLRDGKVEQVRDPATQPAP